MMAEPQDRHANGLSDATNNKRKGFWSKLFGRSTNVADADKKKDDQHKGGLINSLKDNARQAVTREVVHVAEGEARKEVEKALNNNNGSQPTDTTTTNTVPDVTTTPSDALNAPTNWAKRMVDSAQQKMQGLQSLGS